MRSFRAGRSVAVAGFLAVLFMEAWGAQVASADESHPGLALEALYARAALAYDRNRMSEALGLLQQVLAQDPDNVQALELEGLVLKRQGDEKRALSVYYKLIRLERGAARGPYFFEAAVILNRQGGFEQASRYFEAAIRLGFNVAASHLFLGIIRFSHNGNPKLAESDFEEVARDGLPEMQVTAHYYLGLIYMKEGYPARGREELERARDLAATIPGNKTAADAAASVSRVLDSFARPHWFGNVALLAQYDSNISEVPGSSSAQSQASFRSTSQGVLSAGVGYMSPAMAAFQYVPTYQFGYNYNLNSNTEEYEYASNVVSLYLNYKPMDKLSGGLKLQGDFTFQNAPDDPSNLSGSYTFSKYSLTGDVGPFAKLQLAPWARLELDLGLRPQDYYTEPDLSGTDYYFKATLGAETSSAYLNPGASLGYDLDATSGTEFVYRSGSASVFDVLRPTMKDTITVALDYVNYDYFESARRDVTFNPHLSVQHAFSPKWSLIGDVGYTTNTSTLADTYSYNRWVGGAGASYSF